MADVRFDFSYIQNGRLHVKSVHLDMETTPEAPAFLERLEMRIDGSLFLAMPFSYDGADEDDDDYCCDDGDCEDCMSFEVDSALGFHDGMDLADPSANN